MSGSRTCSSCGASNAEDVVYCSSCGALLEGAAPKGSAPLAPTAAVAKRRSLRIKADRSASPSFFSRLKGLLYYLLSVAAGVVIVLALMDPKDPKTREFRDQSIPDARAVVQRVMASSRFAPAGLSQALVNTLLAERGAVTLESPVKLVPMPSWDGSRVEIFPGEVTARTTMTLLGRPIRLSETFRIKGVPGQWELEPVAATVGLLDLPLALLPAATPFVSPGFSACSTELSVLAAAKTLTLRSGLLEFTTR